MYLTYKIHIPPLPLRHIWVRTAQLFKIQPYFCFQFIFLNSIHRFQRACTLYGISDVDLFQTTDLWDFKNIALITQTIFAIGRAVSTFTFETIHFICEILFIIMALIKP